MDPPEDSETPEAKAKTRSQATTRLALGIGLMMAFPFAGMALRHYGLLPTLDELMAGPKKAAFEKRGADPEPVLSAPKSAVVEEPGLITSPAQKSRSLGLIREGSLLEEGGWVVEGEAAPMPEKTGGAPLAEGPLAEMPPRHAEVTPELPRSRYPRLQKVKGFYNTNERSVQDPGTKYYITNEKKKQSKKEVVKQVSKKETVKKLISTLPPIEKPKKRRRRYKAIGAQPNSNTIGVTVLDTTLLPGSRSSPGGPVRTQDVSQGGEIPTPRARRAPRSRPGRGGSTFIIPGDKVPEPNPEKPKIDGGACPRPGWWLNSSSGLCYFSESSCRGGANGRGGCSQPNPRSIMGR